MSANVSEEAVAALDNLANMLEKSNELVEKSISRLQSTLDETKATLGPHANKIATLIETVKQDSEDGSNGVKKLVLSLRMGAELRRTMLEMNGLGNGRSR